MHDVSHGNFTALPAVTKQYAAPRTRLLRGVQTVMGRPARILTAFLAVLFGYSAPFANAAGAELTLAADGRAKMPIVISPQASEPTKKVADELAAYLRRITGADFEIQPGDGSSGIVLGTVAEFPDPVLQDALKLRNGFDGKEAFAIRTEVNRLRVIGATDLATSHAAFALLEELGCRWFFQAPEWEIVPSINTLRVNINRTARPAVLARRIWYGGGFFEHDPAGRPVRDYAAWARHNRMAQSFTINCGHAWQAIIGQNKAVFDEHPEYLALAGGKRQGEQLCVSNPELRAIAVRWALDYLKKHPAADMVSMETSDGGGQCECESCKKLGTVSDRAFGLANEVAAAVAKEYPGKMVGMLAYNEHSEPPAFELEPNVYVQLTAGFTRGKYTFDELLELWPKKCENMGFYEYFSVWPWDFDQLPGGRANDFAYIRRQIPLYVAQGATSIDCESSGNWGLHGRGYYIAHKLMWDPQSDVAALLADFYGKAFGPAAEPMKRYYERFDKDKTPLMSEHLLAIGFRDIEEASQLAVDRPDVQARIDHIKQYLRSVQLRWMVDRAADKETKKELTLAALTHGYRTRYSYMNHYVAIRDGWASQAAVEFEEPTWAATGDRKPKAPWAIDKPYSHDETEAEFRAGLEFFRPDPVEEKEFSNNLVPVEFAGASDKPPAESVQAYQWSLPYAFSSIKGEQLEMTLTAGTIAHYRDMAPATWKVTDAAGNQIAGGRLPLDGHPKPLEVKVPGPGLYFLRFDDSMAGWQIKVPAGRPATIVLERAQRLEHAGWMQSMYFYVPKGTKELHYYWLGQPHRVHGPDGSILKEVKTTGAFVKVPVPEGDDGKPWHFSQMMLGQLWLFNAPPYLAASPRSLLVPRELAKQDAIPAAPTAR